jgi:Flp pilus assembly protein TadG
MFPSRLERRSDEAGVGLIGTSLGALMMMGLLLMAIHTMLALQTRSLVSAAAWDAARALSVDDTLGHAEAQSRVKATIGKLTPTVVVRRTDDSVSVTVSAQSPGIFPGVTTLDDVRQVRRTAIVRVEEQR